MPKPYPKEFRDDVVRAARNRAPGQHLKQIAADYGISESCWPPGSSKAMWRTGSGPAPAATREPTCAKPANGSGCWSRRTKSSVSLRPTCPRPSCRERLYPLVREFAADGIPVAVMCRVLKLACQPHYRWLHQPVTDAELAWVYRANALFDAHRDDPEFGYVHEGRTLVTLVVSRATVVGRPRPCGGDGTCSGCSRSRWLLSAGPHSRTRGRRAPLRP